MTRGDRILFTLGRPPAEPYYQACRLYRRHLRGRPLPQRTAAAARKRRPRARARRFRG